MSIENSHINVSDLYMRLGELSGKMDSLLGLESRVEKLEDHVRSTSMRIATIFGACSVLSVGIGFAFQFFMRSM